MTRTETVVSELFPALPVIPAEVAGPLLRALDLVPRQPDPDYLATEAAGYLETDVDVWFDSLPDDVKRGRR